MPTRESLLLPLAQPAAASTSFLVLGDVLGLEMAGQCQTCRFFEPAGANWRHYATCGILGEPGDALGGEAIGERPPTYRSVRSPPGYSATRARISPSGPRSRDR